MTNRIRIKIGPVEFEAEGDSELIQREREQFFNALPQAVTVITPAVAGTLQLSDTSSEIGKSEEEPIRATPQLPSVINAASFESLPSFLNEKSFSTDIELVMGVAYYLSRVKGIDSFTTKDIENALTDAKQSAPNNVSQCIASNIHKGFLRECSEKKDGLKTYSVLEKGITWCKSYSPKEAEQKRKANRSKTPKLVKDSPLLSVSVDDLHIENYCEISKIQKFKEQVFTVMLIYTKETPFTYFSYRDIVAVFKEKLKLLTATERKVRYVLDKGATMFDKKTEKGIVSHKLTNSGLQRAEQIVAQQRNSNAPLAAASNPAKQETSES
jgi:hypothetical protein